MGKRTFTLEFKFEAVKLVRGRGVTVSQAARDPGIHLDVSRRINSVIGSPLPAIHDGTCWSG